MGSVARWVLTRVMLIAFHATRLFADVLQGDIGNEMALAWSFLRALKID